MNRARPIRSTAVPRPDDARELQDCVTQFAERADPGEVRTLLRILRRWPEMRAVTKDALFAAVVAEFGHVLDVANVPAR